MSAKLKECTLQIDNDFIPKLSQVGVYQSSNSNTCNSHIPNYSVVTAMNPNYLEVTENNNFDSIHPIHPIYPIHQIHLIHSIHPNA